MSVANEPLIHEDLNDTKAAILDAALLEFSEFGFDGTSVRKIGKRADVDFTLITYYFKTKENLWKSVFMRGLERYRVKLKEHLDAAEGQSAGAKLRARFAGEMAFAYSKASMFRMVMNDQSANKERAKWVRENFLDSERASATVLIEEAQASGEIVQGSATLLLRMMQVAIRGLLVCTNEHEKLQEDKESQKEFWDLFERVFFSQLK